MAEIRMKESWEVGKSNTPGNPKADFLARARILFPQAAHGALHVADQPRRFLQQKLTAGVSRTLRVVRSSNATPRLLLHALHLPRHSALRQPGGVGRPA